MGLAPTGGCRSMGPLGNAGRVGAGSCRWAWRNPQRNLGVRVRVAASAASDWNAVRFLPDGVQTLAHGSLPTVVEQLLEGELEVARNALVNALHEHVPRDGEPLRGPPALRGRCGGLARSLHRERTRLAALAEVREPNASVWRSSVRAASRPVTMINRSPRR